jgi:hypothetical protein
MRERDHLEYAGIDGRIILRWIFRKWDVGDMEWIELAQDRDRLGDTCECGNELSGSIKCREFLD